MRLPLKKDDINIINKLIYRSIQVRCLPHKTMSMYNPIKVFSPLILIPLVSMGILWLIRLKYAPQGWDYGSVECSPA
jgi:hypothetical protein